MKHIFIIVILVYSVIDIKADQYYNQFVEFRQYRIEELKNNLRNYYDNNKNNNLKISNEVLFNKEYKKTLEKIVKNNFSNCGIKVFSSAVVKKSIKHFKSTDNLLDYYKLQKCYIELYDRKTDRLFYFYIKKNTNKYWVELKLYYNRKEHLKENYLGRGIHYISFNEYIKNDSIERVESPEMICTISLWSFKFFEDTINEKVMVKTNYFYVDDLKDTIMEANEFGKKYYKKNKIYNYFNKLKDFRNRENKGLYGYKDSPLLFTNERKDTRIEIIGRGYPRIHFNIYNDLINKDSTSIKSYLDGRFSFPIYNFISTVPDITFNFFIDKCEYLLTINQDNTLIEIHKKSTENCKELNYDITGRYQRIDK